MLRLQLCECLYVLVAVACNTCLCKAGFVSEGAWRSHVPYYCGQCAVLRWQEGGLCCSLAFSWDQIWCIGTFSRQMYAETHNCLPSWWLCLSSCNLSVSSRVWCRKLCINNITILVVTMLLMSPLRAGFICSCNVGRLHTLQPDVNCATCCVIDNVWVCSWLYRWLCGMTRWHSLVKSSSAAFHVAACRICTSWRDFDFL